MIGVKLTILCIILLVIDIMLIKILGNVCSTETKLKMAVGNPPAWALVLAGICVLLGVLDIVGIVYSSVWFLFIR